MDEDIFLDKKYLNTLTLNKGIIKDCVYNAEIINDLGKLLYLNNKNLKKTNFKPLKFNKKV
jgi:hypothetical protein